MPPSFRRVPANESALHAFVQRWAAEFPLALEFRDLSWRRQAVLDLCRSFQVTLVSQDLHDVPDLDRAAFDTSNQFAYLRLIGRHDGMSKDRIQRPQTEARRWWIERIRELAERDVRAIFVVVNNHYEGHAPATLRTLAAELTDQGLPPIPCTGWPNGQTTLF
jgi:uncharacterized protein YecE (DUF72 family)